MHKNEFKVLYTYIDELLIVYWTVEKIETYDFVI